MTHKLTEAQIADLRSRLLRAVRMSCPTWLADSSEDITQEAVLRVAAALERQGENRPDLPSSYLKRAAYNAVVDVIRSQRQRRERERPIDGGDGLVADVGSELPDPAHRLEGRRLGGEIQDCLQRLVSPRRAAVALHLQGHTIDETRDLLGWARTKVVNLIYRGLADLRRCLEQKGLKP